jgi:hypothetical protein
MVSHLSFSSCVCGSYFVDRHDFTSRLLDLAELGQKVPESRLGNNIVRSKDSHTVELGGTVLLGGELATHHLIFVEL